MNMISQMRSASIACALAALFAADAALADTPSAFCGTIDPENATYSGIEGLEITLKDGVWEGAPYQPDSAVRPRVGLVRDIEICGDIDGDGENETVVALWYASGGSGTFQYIAVLEEGETGPENTFTAPVGDRVKIEGGAIGDGMVHLDVIQHGPDEPACCPTQAVTRHYDASLKLVNTTERN
jgi:hypothetical protein